MAMIFLGIVPLLHSSCLLAMIKPCVWLKGVFGLLVVEQQDLWCLGSIDVDLSHDDALRKAVHKVFGLGVRLEHEALVQSFP